MMHSIILGLLAGLLLLQSIGCSPEQSAYYQGYAEGEFVYMASPLAGRLEQLEVRRRNLVEEGAPLFVLESDTEAAAVREAEQDLAQRQRHLEDLRKGLRPSELAALEAQLARARAAQELAAGEWQRRRTLFDQGFISREERDLAHSVLAREQATVAQLRAELDTARLGAREDLIAAAAAELEAARARLASAQWALAQKRQKAPTAALVLDTYFEEGEFVPGAPGASAGRPLTRRHPHPSALQPRGHHALQHRARAHGGGADHDPGGHHLLGGDPRT